MLVEIEYYVFGVSYDMYSYWINMVVFKGLDCNSEILPINLIRKFFDIFCISTRLTSTFLVFFFSSKSSANPVDGLVDDF